MKIFEWFKTQKAIIEELSKLDEMLSLNVEILKKKIEELDQDKVYYIQATEVEKVKEFFKILKKQMKWTMPKIIISNAPITKISKKELKKLMR